MHNSNRRTAMLLLCLTLPLTVFADQRVENTFSDNSDWQCAQDAAGTWNCSNHTRSALPKAEPEPSLRGKPSPYRPVSRDSFDPGSLTANPTEDSDDPAVRPVSSRTATDAQASPLKWRDTRPADQRAQAERRAERPEIAAGTPPNKPTMPPASQLEQVPVHKLPKYLQLAHQPSQPTPIESLPASFWTVQLAAVKDLDALQNFVRVNRLQGLIGAAIDKGGETFYALLLGVYESRADAEQAANHRPDPLSTYTPWVRSLGGLQKIMIPMQTPEGAG